MAALAPTTGIVKVALAVLIASFVAVPAVAQSMAASGATPTSTVIHVKRCDPQLTAPVAVGPYGGFRPGFYSPYWGDVYGYRYYQPALSPANATLYIDYMNVTNKVMSAIEFGLLANGRLVAEVRDVGKFSPSAEIKHQFGLSTNVFPIQTGLPQCVALRITFADGTKWRNPRLPKLQRALYGPSH